MIRTLLILLTVTHGFVAGAQTMSNFNYTRPDDLSKFLAGQPAFCGPGKAPWINHEGSSAALPFAEKLSIVHFGSFDNLYSNHNTEALSQLQRAFPDLNVVLVHNPKFNFPTEKEDVQAMVNLYDIPLPVLLDHSFEMWTCNGIETWPTTLFVAPDGKILDRQTGVLDYRTLERNIPLALRMLALLSPLNKQPFLGRRPSEANKLPILQYPIAIEKNAAQQLLFVSDFMGNRIWVLGTNGDVVHVIGSGEAGSDDGPWAEASFDGPWGLAWDALGNALYVADHRNHRIRKIDFAAKAVTTLLGNGQRTETGREKGVGKAFGLGFPTQISHYGFELYVALGADAQIWRCDLRTEVTERLAGSGSPGMADGRTRDALLSQPVGIVRDKAGLLFFSDAQSSSIRAIEGGQVVTKAGTGLFDHGHADGRRDEVAFQYALGMAWHGEELLVADAYNHCLRSFDPYRQRAETVAGGGLPGYRNDPGTDALFRMPTDVVEMGGVAYVTDAGNGLIRTVDLGSKAVGALTLYNYGEVAQGTTRMITDLRDASGIKAATGNNIFHIQVDLPEMYEFDPMGFSTMAIASRNDSLFIRTDEMLTKGRITLDYQLEPGVLPVDAVVDFNLYFREKKQPERQFFRAVSYVIPVAQSANPTKAQRITLAFDPDAPHGGAAQKGDGMFME